MIQEKTQKQICPYGLKLKKSYSLLGCFVHLIKCTKIKKNKNKNQKRAGKLVLNLEVIM
jgi:hypothetical protein